MHIANPLKWLLSAGAFALGTDFYIGILGIMVLSLPFNVIALMHLFGWGLWSVLIAVGLMTVIPGIGQLAYVGLAIAGAVFLYQANFDWHLAAYPDPKTISIAAMNPGQFDEFKKNITPLLERDCKRGALAQNSVDGKLPIQISKRCECIARIVPDIFSQADFVYQESHNGEAPEASKDRLRSAVTQRCYWSEQ
jgi:hypothetical protein